MLDWHIMGKVLVSDGEKTVDIYQTSFYTNHVKKTRELVYQAERKLRTSTHNLIWIMPT